MTVAEIKEYIDEKLKRYDCKGQGHFTPIDDVNKILFDINSMLDELEPKEESKNNELELFTNTLDAYIGTHNEIINIELTQEQALRLKKAIEYLTEAITKEYYND